MPKIEGPTIALTFDGLLLAAAVIILVFVLASTIKSGTDAIRGMSVRGRVKTLEDQMKTVNERLKKGSRKFRDQSDDIGQLLIVNQSMLMHFITGNDHEKLRETNKSLVAYIAARASREREDDAE